MQRAALVNFTYVNPTCETTVIRFRLAELLADKGFREGRRVEIGEVADATGIHRSTLSRIVNVRGANVTAANLDKLCAYFGCSLSDLAEYVPDAALQPASNPQRKLQGSKSPRRTSRRRDDVPPRGI
jgi:putative transcriptional regulator